VLKIASADCSEVSNEGTILSLLQQDGQCENIVKLIDKFVVKGPNGEHNVIAIEPLGPTLKDLTESVHHENPDWLAFARKSIVQLIKGLAFVHSKGIAHRGRLPNGSSQTRD
jgi:serine/threonine protein kinase